MQRYIKPLAIALVVLVTAVLAYFYISAPSTRSVAPTPTPFVSVAPTPPTKAELLKLVNQERAKAGAAPLVDDPRLDQSAQRKADDEIKYNYFGHISPHDGKHGYEYINDVGISCTTDSENLTENTHVNTTQAAITAWVNSKPHHEAMLNPSYSLTGFGIDGTQIVEHFCQQ